MLVRCNECNQEISDKATICPHCGCPISVTLDNLTVPSQNTIFTIDGVDINMNLLLSEYPKRTDAIKRIRELSGANLQTATRAVDDYLNQNNTSASDSIKQKKKDSPLSVIAFLLTFFGCGFVSVIGLLLAIMDLSKKDTQYGHGWSKAAIGIFVGWCLLWSILDGNNDNNNEENTPAVTTQATTKEPTTEVATTESQLSVEELKEQAQEVTYEDIYRYPETHKNKPIKITVYVNEYDTQYLGFSEVYYCTVDGQDVFITDSREVKEPTIAKGDTVVIYGIGSGMATLTESQKNIIGLTTNSEKSKIPSIDLYYAEFQ